MIGERRSIGQMPLKRRHQGLSGMERHGLIQLWRRIVAILTYLVAAVQNGANVGGLIFLNVLAAVHVLIARARAVQRVVWAAHAPIDRASLELDRVSLPPTSSLETQRRLSGSVLCQALHER